MPTIGSPLLRIRQLLPFAAVALVAAECASDAATQTWRIAHEVYDARGASADSSRTDWIDGWGRAFRFELRGVSFQLISAGADGAFGTSDDLDFSPEYLAARATAISGCWTTSSMMYPDGELRSVVLANQKIDGAPDFRGSTGLAGTDTRWTPWGSDSVVVFLMVGPQRTVIRAKVDQDVLRGSRTLHGEGPGPMKSRRDFEARRGTCDSPKPPIS